MSRAGKFFKIITYYSCFVHGSEICWICGGFAGRA